MAVSHRHVEWAQYERDRCADLAALGVSAEKSAAILNREFHKRRPVRTEPAVANFRRKFKLKVAKVPKQEVEVVAGVETEQRVERTETEQGISLHATGQRIKTVADLLKYAEIDLTRYEVSRQKANTWDTTIRDRDGKVRTVQNFQVTVEVRPKSGPSTLEAVEALIAGAKLKPVTLPRPARVVADPALMQAVVIADPHVAKYAWDRETGAGDYDIGIATQLLRDRSAALLADGDARKPAERWILLLGDFFHYDTPNGQTTSGTALDRDGRVPKMMEEGVSALCDIIATAAATCPTKVMMVGGNHDYLLTFALRMILATRFAGSDRVTVSDNIKARQYYEWGEVLLGLTHGDKATKRLDALMGDEARVQSGRCRHREWHHGHLHSEALVTTVGGIVIRQHPALCPPDGWHYESGYTGAPRAMHTHYYHQHDGHLGSWVAGVR